MRGGAPINLPEKYNLPHYGRIANSFAILSGADIVRVHDVKEAVDMVNVLSALLGVSA